MSSKELSIIQNKKQVLSQIKELQQQLAIYDRQLTVQKWLRSIKGDSPEDRIPNSSITIIDGTKEHRIAQLKQAVELKEIVGIVAMQIADLQDFLNVKTKMTEVQIFDTAEFIVESYDFMSFTLIQDCFNRIKKAMPPFDGSMYNSIDGRKIMESLQKYDIMLDEKTFGVDLKEAMSKYRHSMDDPQEVRRTINEIIKQEKDKK